MEEYTEYHPENRSIVPVGRNKLNILITDEDKNGRNVAKMSDFMGLYAQQQTSALVDSKFVEVMTNLPIADLSILGDVITQASAVVKSDLTLVPDMDHIPNDIKQGLKDGLYKIGESKQVDGNLRAVIVDAGGTRVKDITLKRVINNPGTIDTTRSIANQLQMKQINEKLAAIQEIQDYQLDKDRDEAILVPFLNARDNIWYAQIASSAEERNKYLEIASEQLDKAKNSVYAEINTATKHLAKFSKRSIFTKQSSYNKLISHITDDLQMSTRICGIQMQIFEFLERPDNARIALEQYQREMHDFIHEPVGNCGFTGIELVHDNYPYSKDNLDCWFKLSKELEPALENTLPGNRNAYIISLEETENE